MAKINCPFHEETTASCHIYETHFHCFGCGKRGTIDELEVLTPVKHNMRTPRKGWAKTENLQESLTRIQSLPTRPVRGFVLPYDDTGYYVVYPHNEYYVKRLWHPKGNADKYRGPAGHKKPLMIYDTNSVRLSNVLFVVEGQINAMTLYKCSGLQTCSPGSASDLNRPVAMQYYLQYAFICIIVDKDPAGVVAGIALRDELIKQKKEVVLLPLERDLNDLYVQEGKEAVNGVARSGLELLKWL